ncbi:MAG TPA: dienelactone hydrolase family protein [Gammaproteobacteria bacterium]|nr:dienelactone hydrolase family protein [Gammaproteobacteria bacterium]
MKVLFTLMVVTLLVACQQAEEPGASLVEATAAEHSHDSPTPSPLVEPPPAVPVLEQELAYGEAGSRNLVGFLAMPGDAAEPLPGVLVIHEWWGLNDNIKAVTRRLAGEGYVALAVDLYGGAVADAPEQAQELMAELLAEPDAARANLRQAYEYLEKYAFSPTIGSIGWCLGGGWSLQTALMLPDQLDAMVMYYGQVVTDPAQLEPLKMPLLGLFGELDQSIPVREVQTFRTVLNELGKNATILIVLDADHAFANPSGGNYNAQKAAEAWETTLAFLNKHLKPPQVATND